METNISQRLLDVADFIPQGAKLLDVGSDHAYLPIHLLQEGLISQAIASEVVQGPYRSALENVAAAGLNQKIQVRLADGLEALEPNDGVTTIAICGMGGRLIADILTAGQEKLSGLERLVLQPNNREDDVRAWLSDHGFKIIAEKVMSEKGKFYEIIVAQPGQQVLNDFEKRFGPRHLEEKSAGFLTKWQRELEKLQVALSKIPEANQADSQALEERIQAIKEAIQDEG